MREILFRAKRVDTGEWVLGVCHHSKMFYGEGCVCVSEIDPATVGQYTGLKDKNGKRIFEGDILDGAFGKHKVYFDEDNALFDWECIDAPFRDGFTGFSDEYEVIGNIHDNPELLEVEG